MSSDVTEKQKQYSIIRIPKLDSTKGNDPAPEDRGKTMQYSVDRLPVELPGVMGAADLDYVYEFSSYGQTADWGVNAFTAVGDEDYEAGSELDTVCDTDAISSSDPTVFTYIFTANTLERELFKEREYILDKAWLLGATVAGPSGVTPVSNPPTSAGSIVYSPLVGLGFGVQNTTPPNDNTWEGTYEGLSIKPGTCGIQKGPAMPLRAPSPYLTSPGFLPAISLPGVTAPSTTPEEREKPFDETGFSVGISFTDHYGADIEERQVCYNQYEDPQYSKICLNVSVTYNPSSEEYFDEIPAGSTFKVVLSFEGNKNSIKILDTTGNSELLNSAKQTYEIPIVWDRKKGTSISEKYCMQWVRNGSESDFEATTLKASVESVIRHSKDFPKLLNDTTSDTLDFKCSSAPLDELYTIDVEVKDNAEKTVSERNCCDSNDSVADSNLLTAYVRVAKTEKGKKSYIDTKNVVSTLYITPPEGVDVVLGHAQVSRPSNAKYPLKAKINIPDSGTDEVLTKIQFQYFSPVDWGCGSDYGKKDSVNIEVLGCIQQGSASVMPDSCSGLSSKVDIELKCDCDDCSSKLASLTTSISFLEEGSSSKAKNPRRVCGGDGTADPMQFVCEVAVDGWDNLDEACADPTKKPYLHIEASSKDGTLLAFGPNFNKFDTITQTIENWSADNRVGIFYEPPSSVDDNWTGKISVNAWLTPRGEIDADAIMGDIGLSDAEMRLSCKDPSEDEVCAANIECALNLFERGDYECTQTKLKLTRIHGTEGGAEDSNPAFCVSPKIYLGKGTDLTSCSVPYKLTLKPRKCRLAILEYNPSYSYEERVYSGEFTATTDYLGLSGFTFLYQPNSKEDGSITVTLEVSKEHTDSDGNVVTDLVTAEKTIKIDYRGKDEDDDDDDDDDDESSAICGVLDGLTAADPLSISACVAGKREISLTKGCWMSDWLTIAKSARDVLTLSDCDSEGMRVLDMPNPPINCSVLKDMAGRGSGITVDCNNGGSISAKELTQGDGISINNYTVSVNVDGKTIQIKNGKLEAVPAQEISCSAIKKVLEQGDGISIGSCTNGKIKISATGPASLPEIKGSDYINVTKNTDGSYTISLKNTKKCDA